MDPRFNDQTNKSFANYVIVIVFLLWNMFGCIMYLVDVMAPDEYYLKMYGQNMLDLRHEVPLWTISTYALAVWSGLIAAILLMRRNKMALNVFMFSLVMAIISFIWMFTSSVAAPLRTGGYWVMPLFVVVMGVIEIWYTRRRIAEGAVT